jgi:hypothetical protein
MESLAYVMALLGCGEGEMPCSEIRLAPTRYENQAQCLAASEAEIARATDVDYPVVVAQCRKSGERPQAIAASEVTLPDPEPNRHFPIRRR